MKLQQGRLKVDAAWTIGVVTSRFNSEITERLGKGALDKLLEMGFKAEQLRQVRVPGAVEIPLAAKFLIDSGCQGVVALGCVIKGETAHFEYVCNSVERGCTELQLTTGVPIGFGVITTYTDEQAEARAGGAHGNKGAEAAEVVVEMINLKKQILTP